MEQRGALGHASQALCNSFLTAFFWGGGVGGSERGLFVVKACAKFANSLVSCTKPSRKGPSVPAEGDHCGAQTRSSFERSFKPASKPSLLHPSGLPASSLHHAPLMWLVCCPGTFCSLVPSLGTLCPPGLPLSSRSSCDCSSRASVQVCSQVLTLIYF